MQKNAEDGCKKSAVCQRKKVFNCACGGVAFLMKPTSDSCRKPPLVGGVTPSVKCLLELQQLHSGEVKLKETTRRVQTYN